MTIRVTDTTEQWKDATVNDIENDAMLYMTIRSDVISLVHKLQDFQKREAFAVPQDDTLSDLIEAMDDILADVCGPKDKQIVKARQYHDQHNDQC